ncbi:PREDICTED: thymic stromal lymphopoietin [Chinchilla lanigera]|uniref:thymic stromal lymphopoietin n=1 Tax=Chinchilla lanigera TaxID=34839 RepID=UPI00038EE464|nr:PREDICTED: thymic stromal lymphopoietin [Chinchilla lanigera]
MTSKKIIGLGEKSPTFPNALLLLLSGFFKIFLFQLVGLVLTFNFNNCDFKKIRDDYDNLIVHNLNDYMNKRAVRLAFREGVLNPRRLLRPAWDFGSNLERGGLCRVGRGSERGCPFFPPAQASAPGREGNGKPAKARSPGPPSERPLLRCFLAPPAWPLRPAPAAWQRPSPPGASLSLSARDLSACPAALTPFLLTLSPHPTPFPAFSRVFLNVTAACEQSDCLTKIVRHTFNSTTCPSLSEELFAWRTNATLARYCPEYSTVQINNTQKMQQKVTRECLEQTSQIIGWWRFFSRLLGKKNYLH